MSVYWGIPGSTSEVLSVPVRNVLSSFWVSESLGQTKIDNVDVMLFFADANQEVIWFDVSVQEMPRMHELYSL